MLFLRLVSIVMLGSILSSCMSSSISSAGKKPSFTHAKLGDVRSNHPELAKVREACGKQAYTSGLMIRGKLVVDRDVAIKIWAKDLMMSFRGMRYTSRRESHEKRFTYPYSNELKKREKATWDCVEKGGFTRINK